MSGTSLDGIDVAFLETDGHQVLYCGPYRTYPYTQEQQNYLHKLLTRNVDWEEGDNFVAQWHIQAIQKFQIDFPESKNVDLIGFHGQTVFHSPQKGMTRALGNGALVAESLGIDVACDFRKHDIASGGCGAPLVPIFHKSILRAYNDPCVFLNLGGIANVTYVDKDILLAFDVAPCNSLLNDWILKNTGNAYDRDGEYASQGRCNVKILDHYARNEFFAKHPPKALDRQDFTIDCLEGLSCADGAATLVALLVKSLQSAYKFFPSNPKKTILCGGGRNNDFIVETLQNCFQNVILIDEEMGLDGDAIEAYAFAFLAVRSFLRLPLTFPTTTGCKYPTTGGYLCRASKR